MKWKICIYDRDSSRNDFISFICKKVLCSLDVDFELIDPVSNLETILCEEKLIIFYNPDNDLISTEQLVDYIICKGSKAILLTVTDSSEKLFRVLPAVPFDFINADSFESELPEILKKAIEKVNVEQ